MYLNNMREFFVNEYPHFLFKPFGLIHNLFTIFAILVAVVIFINRNKISKHGSYKELRVFAIILLLNMIIYTVGNLYYGSFDYKTMLPFHLCFIANYLFIIGCLFKKEKILRITLYMSFIGPIPAILWPDLVSTIDNYNFWQLIISHHIFLNMSLYSYFALNYQETKKELGFTFIALNIAMLISLIFNKIFDTNYIFTNYIPENVIELYPFLSKVPTLIVLELTGLIIALLIYFTLIRFRNKELKEKSLQLES